METPLSIGMLQSALYHKRQKKEAQIQLDFSSMRLYTCGRAMVLRSRFIWKGGLVAVRSLRPFEQAIAQQIFQNGLDYERIRINEGSQLPNRIGQLGALLRGKPAPQANAVTVGNTSYFPRELTSDDVDMGWLMHELTHQWQYQHVGIVYLAQAIVAPTYVYCNQGETPANALSRCSSEGKTFFSFNREQQGDIVRDYYFASKQALDSIAQLALSAWAPYLQALRKPKT
jgi:hypothetical protein